MNRLRIIQIAVSVLFLLGLGLGIAQRDESFFGSTTSLYSSIPSGNTLEDFYNKSQALKVDTEQTSQVSFLSVGDIMLSRNVAQVTKDKKQDLWPFIGMEKFFKKVDFSFGNLETPVAKTGGTIGGHSLIFNSPKEIVEGLSFANFKIVNLANNHAFDQGYEGLKYTIEFLNGLGIKHIGTGESLEEAWKPEVVEQNGIKICFIGASYSSVNDGGQVKNNYVARIQDTENLKNSISNSKALCDFTVVTMHAGTEYTRTPNQAQINFAHSAIDFGADIVIGAHPHWVQTIEKYNEKYIFYSLGNFIFDQNFSQDTKEGLVLKIQISNNKYQNSALPGSMQGDQLQGQKQYAKLEQIELIPVIIDNSQPRPANETESKKILNKINQTESILK